MYTGIYSHTSVRWSTKVDLVKIGRVLGIAVLFAKYRHTHHRVYSLRT